VIRKSVSIFERISKNERIINYFKNIEAIEKELFDNKDRIIKYSVKSRRKS